MLIYHRQRRRCHQRRHFPENKIPDFSFVWSNHAADDFATNCRTETLET